MGGGGPLGAPLLCPDVGVLELKRFCNMKLRTGHDLHPLLSPVHPFVYLKENVADLLSSATAEAPNLQKLLVLDTFGCSFDIVRLLVDICGCVGYCWIASDIVDVP